MRGGGRPLWLCCCQFGCLGGGCGFTRVWEFLGGKTTQEHLKIFLEGFQRKQKPKRAKEQKQQQYPANPSSHPRPSSRRHLRNSASVHGQIGFPSSPTIFVPMVVVSVGCCAIVQKFLVVNRSKQ